MNLIEHIISYWNKPFPIHEGKHGHLKLATSISIFVAAFLYFFQPFGVHQLTENKGIICLAFGVVSFLSITIYEYASEYLFKLKASGIGYTFGRWIIHVSGLILFISFCNFLFSCYLGGAIQWQQFPRMLMSTLGIGLFPTVGLGALGMQKEERKYQNLAQTISPITQIEPNLTSAELHGIPYGSIQYVEAVQNYIKICYVSTDGSLAETVIRSTLKAVEAEIKDSSLVRCHRSFIVNKGNIANIEGNAQGLSLTLSKSQEKIPVSRKYIPVFK